MRKKVIIILLSLILISLLTIIVYKSFSKPKTYIEINFNKLQKKVTNEEDFILFIGSETCSHCSKYKKTINRVIEDYKIYVYYIDISKLEDSEYAYLNSHFPFSGTPTTLVVKDGKIYEPQICSIKGAQSYDYTINKFKKAGIIKE